MPQTSIPLPHIQPDCADWLLRGGLAPLSLCGRNLLPIVQGGMGIGVSANRLSGSVAALGGMGTVSSVDLRRHHPDLVARTSGLGIGPDAKLAIDAANLEALEREITLARARSQGRGLLAINVMRAVSAYGPSVQRALECGIEQQVPLIAAGGVRRFEDIAYLQGLGASAVQLGTPFAVTLECDAHAEFKRVLAEATDDQLVEFTSVAGLPARAVSTPWLRAYLAIENKLQAVAHVKSRCTKSFDCLAQCGLRDGMKTWGQFCIDHQLAAALRGDLKKGLFFRGVGALPFGTQIRSVRDLVRTLSTGDQLAAV